LGIKIETPIKVLKIESPPAKSAGVKVADVDELISKLRNEAKLI
jgi:electron transfer flavoprotein beta subunit